MNIREARKRAGMSQTQLAELVGVDQSGVSRIERGERPVTVDMLKAIARALGVRPAALLDDTKRAA
jgi:transcriptional regulator with XRE-family HTH domain